MCCALFILLLLAHVLGDFYCQTNKYCELKRERKFKSWFLYVHPIIIGALSWGMVWDWSFAICAIIITVSHFIIDTVKCFIKNDGLLPFTVDQLLHLAIITCICFLWEGADYWVFPQWCYMSDNNLVVALTGALILGKPANIVIKKTLDQYKITKNGKVESNNVGSLIGTLERLLTLLFIMVGEMSAVGFLLAAKSILRFRDTDTVKTEYVLAGTLLSFGIAIAVGMITYYKVFRM